MRATSYNKSEIMRQAWTMFRSKFYGYTFAEALKMASKEERENYLTQFSVSQANALFAKWKALDEYLLVKFIDGNIKRQNEDGSFKNNGHVKHVPPAPIYGGYSDTYKRAVAKEQKEKK